MREGDYTSKKCLIGGHFTAIEKETIDKSSKINKLCRTNKSAYIRKRT